VENIDPEDRKKLTEDLKKGGTGLTGMKNALAGGS